MNLINTLPAISGILLYGAGARQPGARREGACLLYRLLSLTGLLALCLLALPGCRGGADFDPRITTGRIAGELIIIGPVNRELDLNVGVTRVGREDSVEQAALGRLVSAAAAQLNGRSISYDFSQLPAGTYTIVLYGAAGGVDDIYYRSDKVRLTGAAPEITGLSAELSLTGPPPWGTISGTLLLSGARPPSLDMLLYVTDRDDRRFQYEFNMWDADFGAMYFAVGGLALGEYTLSLSEPAGLQPLGLLADPVALSAGRPNPDGVVLWGEFPVPQTTAVSYSIGGKVVFSARPPVPANLALIAVRRDSPDLGTSPIFHIQPELVDAGFQEGFFLTALAEGTYDLRVYALDFSGGNHQVIGGLSGPLVLEGDSQFYDRLQVPADVSLIP